MKNRVRSDFYEGKRQAKKGKKGKGERRGKKRKGMRRKKEEKEKDEGFSRSGWECSLSC